MMSLSDQQAEFTDDLARLISFANRRPGMRVRLRDAYRSTLVQETMHDTYPETYAPADNSQHPKGLAADLVLDERIEGRWEYQTETERYRWLGEQWELISLWNRWGGRFSRGDGGHFERMNHIRTEPPLVA